MTTSDEINISNCASQRGSLFYKEEDSEDRQVILEVAKAINDFADEKNMTRAAAIREISTDSNVGVRTLERFFSQNGTSFKPQVRIVMGVFSKILDADSDTDILLKTSPLIKNFIEKNHSRVKRRGSSDFSKNVGLEKILTTSDIFNEVYMMSSGEFGTDKVSVLELYGNRGLIALDTLLTNGFVVINSDERIVRDRKLSWEYPVRKNFINTLLNVTYNEESLVSQNPALLSVIHGEVTPEDYQIIREMLVNCQDKISEIINNSKPTIHNVVKVASSALLQQIGTKSYGANL